MPQVMLVLRGLTKLFFLFLQQIVQEVLFVTGESHSQSVLKSVRTDKGLAQYSKIPNCREMGQVNGRNTAARKK